MVKNLPVNARNVGLIPGLGSSPGEGKWQPTPVFLPGKFHGQMSLVSYIPWDHKDSDRTEHLTPSHHQRFSVLNEAAVLSGILLLFL